MPKKSVCVLAPAPLVEADVVEGSVELGGPEEALHDRVGVIAEATDVRMVRPALDAIARPGPIRAPRVIDEREGTASKQWSNARAQVRIVEPAADDVLS